MILYELAVYFCLAKNMLVYYIVQYELTVYFCLAKNMFDSYLNGMNSLYISA
jgi:hypothetical protein